jgi:hypothetical protein
MRTRFQSVLFVPCLVLPSACGDDDDGKPSAAGATITVKVDGQTLRFEKAHAKLQSFLGGSWMLDFSSDQGDGTNLSFCFFTDAKTAAELADRSLENDYREHNPDRYPRRRHHELRARRQKEYQGWLVKGMVRSVSDKADRDRHRRDVLEFPRNWMDSTGETPPTGREVQLSASIIVPLEIETS